MITIDYLVHFNTLYMVYFVFAVPQMYTLKKSQVKILRNIIQLENFIGNYSVFRHILDKINTKFDFTYFKGCVITQRHINDFRTSYYRLRIELFKRLQKNCKLLI